MPAAGLNGLSTTPARIFRPAAAAAPHARKTSAASRAFRGEK
jgi:hypothetical protein